MPLTEAPSSRVAFLETFPCLNPFTAASLGACQCSLQELLHRPVDELRKLVPDVPVQSLNLFLCQAAWGEPVRGLQASGRSSCNYAKAQEPSQHRFQTLNALISPSVSMYGPPEADGFAQLPQVLKAVYFPPSLKMMM